MNVCVKVAAVVLAVTIAGGSVPLAPDPPVAVQEDEMRRAVVPISRRRAQRSVHAIFEMTRVRQSARAQTPYRLVTELTREGSRITLEDLRYIARILTYVPSRESMLARISDWQSAQIRLAGYWVQ